MRIRLPLHHWAEQLQTVMANRMYRPHCTELKNEQYRIWRKMVAEYRYMIEELHDSKTTLTRIEAALKSETHHPQVPRSNSTDSLR